MPPASCPATYCSNSLIWNVLLTCLLLQLCPSSQSGLSSFLYSQDPSLLFESRIYIFSPCLPCDFCTMDSVSPFGHPVDLALTCPLFTLPSARPALLPASPISVNCSSVFLSAEAEMFQTALDALESFTARRSPPCIYTAGSFCDILLTHCYHYSPSQGQ